MLAKLARRESAALLSKGRCACALTSRETHRSAPGALVVSRGAAPSIITIHTISRAEMH